MTSVTLPDPITSITEGAFFKCSSLEHIDLPASITSICGDGDFCGAFEGCSALKSIIIPIAATVHDDAFDGCTLLEAKSSIYYMSVVEYYRDYYYKRLKERIAVLTSLKIYQEFDEMEPPPQRRRFELLPEHLNGPRSYRKITAFEMWREIVMFL